MKSMKSMKSKALGLLLVGILATLAMYGNDISAAKKVTKIKLGHIWSLDHPIHRASLKLADDVKKASSGKVEIQVFPASQLGAELEQWQAVSNGIQHMTIGGSGFQWDSRFTLFDIPYALKDYDHIMRVYNSPIGEDLNNSLISKANIRILGAWYYGTRQLTTSKKIVKSPADLKGFKIRIPSLEAHRVAWTTMGASPTVVPFSETYMALSQGTVDGQENPIASIGGMKFNEVQKYLVITNHVTQANQVVINEKFYQKLPKDVQKLLSDYVKSVADYEEQLQYEDEAKWLEIFKQSGMEIIETDQEAFVKAVDGVGEFFTEKYKWGNLWKQVQELR